jgi:hypothetical protein
MVNDVLAIRTLEAGNLAVFSERVVAFCATQLSALFSISTIFLASTLVISAN